MDPLALYVHQNNCVWRVVEWIIPIEAGVITGAFTRPGLPGLCIAILGIFLSLAFNMYAFKSARDRDVNRAIIEKVISKKYGSKKYGGFLLRSKAKFFFQKGSFWLEFEFVVLYVSNAFIAFLEICKWQDHWKNVTSIFFP